jgi:hypothetical protein
MATVCHGARLKLIVFIFVSLFGGTALAGETVASLVQAGIKEICADFAAIVSKAEGNFTSRNRFGCLGAFQFCPATLVQYFTGTAGEFLNSPTSQTGAWTNYEKTQWALAKKNGLSNLIGLILDLGPAGPIKITASSILMACQFGCGKFGLLANFVNGGKDCDASDVKDGFGVSVCSYLAKGVGKNVSCFTGEPPDVETKPSPTPSETIAAKQPESPGVCADLGKDGPLEILVGRYTLRFGSTASAETIKKYLDVIASESK